jgi:hypothetical protein
MAMGRTSFHYVLALLVVHAASAALLHAQSIPTPESVFGFPVGADGRLFDYAESIRYFQQLDAASDHITLMEVGKTSFGRTWTVALISSPENLARIARFKEINQRLARPDGLTDEEALRLAREGRALVDISGGLHASEVAGSQHTPQLAYELLSKTNDPAVKQMLDNVILFLWPTINPDGQDIVVQNCRERDAGRNPGPMELYQKYIGHDNNRDSYMLNVVESRVIGRVWREWEPHIIYVHHQSSPEPTRIWIPPFADPVGLRAPPITARTINTIGMTIAQELDAAGRPGAAHALATFDAWYPGYIDYMPVYQNIAAFWTETQGGSCANPKPPGTPANFPTEYRALRPTALYLSPWEGGPWRLRDAVDYMVTASLATLKYAARFKDELLYNRYQAGRNTIRKYRANAPFAYLVPQKQHDPVAPVELLQRLAFLGIRVLQATRDFNHDGVTYAAGTWVIPLDQEYGELARTLLEVQQYPDMGNDTPYDAAGWTLPLQMHVNIVEVKTPLTAELRALLQPVAGQPADWRTTSDEPFTTNATAAGILPLPGGITGRGDHLLLDPAQNNSFRLINRALADGARLRYLPAQAGAHGGRYVVSGGDARRLDAWARELSVVGERARNTAGALPTGTRIALFKAGPNNMDVGWTEWLLDTHGFRYTVIDTAFLRGGALREKFDVILFASQGPGGGGGRRGGGPPAGAPAQPNRDAAAVDSFVQNGGTAVFWNAGAAAAAAALNLPVRNVVAGLPAREYFTGISIVEAIVDTRHPVMAGMPERASVVVSRSPVFTTTEGFEGTVLATYPAAGSPLRSGFLNGAEYMQGNAAAVDVKRGLGHVILIAFQPQWRGQPTGTFRVVFNSLFYGGGAPAGR